jgi:aryl-alcohol dehydrogenase-like predicted oxidoreductase
MKMRIGDLEVRRLGFGAMRVIDNDDIWGEPRDRANSLRVLRRAVELGVEFFDTAQSYGPHTDETLIAQALYPYPKGLVVATKCGLSRPSPERWDADCRPGKLRADLEGSLKRLKLEREGKVRHVGLSNVTVNELEAARKIVPIVSVQNRYSLADRASDDVLLHCEKLGIAFLPWYPLGDGSALTLSRVKKLSGKIGATPAQIAIAWLLKKSPVMLPIPGTSKVPHLEENVAAAQLALSEEDFKSL